MVSKVANNFLLSKSKQFDGNVHSEIIKRKTVSFTKGKFSFRIYIH